MKYFRKKIFKKKWKIIRRSFALVLLSVYVFLHIIWNMDSDIYVDSFEYEFRYGFLFYKYDNNNCVNYQSSELQTTIDHDFNRK